MRLRPWLFTVSAAATVLALPGWSEVEDETPLAITDLRFDVAMVPETKDPHLKYNMPGFSAEESVSGLDLGVRLDLGLVKSVTRLEPYGGLIVGVFFFDTQQSGDELQPGVRIDPYMTGPIKFGAMGADVLVGYAYAFNRIVHAEIAGFYGYGNSTVSDSGVQAGAPDNRTGDTGHGTYHEYGLRIGLHATSEDLGLQGMIGFNWLRAHARDHTHFNTTAGVLDIEYTIDQVGIEPYVGFGMRF
jgi:hypothetical protein